MTLNLFRPVEWLSSIKFYKMIRRLLTLFLFLFSFNLFAQNDTDPFLNENGDRFLPGIIALKVKDTHREACKVDMVAIAELESALVELEFISMKKKFPNVLPPETEFNDHGHRLADISLLYELKVPETTDIEKAVMRLNTLESLEYAEPHYVSHDMYTPNDAGLASQDPYHFNTISVYDAWDVTQGDTNVVIGITDTSFDVDHEDMSNNIKYNYDDPIGNGDEDLDNYIDNYAGWDMVDDDNNLFINNEIHGTAVAAIASAETDNGIGYAGVGFKCKFLPVKVGDNLQVITHGYEGIQYCVEQGCSVVNCSWGNTTFSQVAQDIITWAAINNDVVIVAAAGNDDATPMFYPASYNYALSVTGVNADDVFDNGVNPPFTRNDSVDVSAPGYDVYTTATYDGNPLYAPPQGGTSMAAPVVAGVAALVRSHCPFLTALQVIEQIKATADDIDAIAENVPYAGLLGTGRVNAHAALTGELCDPVGSAVSETDATGLHVYPNPANDAITFRMDRAAEWLKIYDASGKLVLKQGFEGKRITLSGLDAGFYVARVSVGGNLITRKFSVSAR